VRECHRLLLVGFLLLVSVKSIAGEAYVERSQNDLTVAEIALYKAKSAELWDSEDPRLFEIALLGGPIGRFRNKVLAGGVGPMGSRDEMAAKMWKRFENTKNPDIQAVILSYMPLTAIDKSQDKALNAFRKSPHSKVRAAALALLNMSGAFRKQKTYGGFVKEALEWLTSDKAEVDLTYAIRQMYYWIDNGTIVRTRLSKMTRKQQQCLLDRLAEYLASRDALTRERAAKALIATRLRNAYSILLETAERMRGDACLKLLDTLLMRTEQLPLETWESPAGMRILRRAIIDGEDSLSNSAERKYGEVLKKRFEPKAVRRQLIVLRLSRLQVTVPRSRVRLIRELNRDKEEVNHVLEADGQIVAFGQTELESLKKEGLHESILKNLPVSSTSKLSPEDAGPTSKTHKKPVPEEGTGQKRDK